MATGLISDCYSFAHSGELSKEKEQKDMEKKKVKIHFGALAKHLPHAITTDESERNERSEKSEKNSEAYGITLNKIDCVVLIRSVQLIARAMIVGSERLCAIDLSRPIPKSHRKQKRRNRRRKGGSLLNSHLNACF